MLTRRRLLSAVATYQLVPGNLQKLRRPLPGGPFVRLVASRLSLSVVRPDVRATFLRLYCSRYDRTFQCFRRFRSFNLFLPLCLLGLGQLIPWLYSKLGAASGIDRDTLAVYL